MLAAFPEALARSPGALAGPAGALAPFPEAPAGRTRVLTSHAEHGWLFPERQAQNRFTMTNQTELHPSDIFRATLYSIGDAVLATDAASRVMQMNASAEALTGWTEDQARGRPLEQVFRIVNEDTGQPVQSPVERVLRTGAIVGLANHTMLVARDGTERPIADSGAPIRDRDGTIVGVVLVFRDQSPERAEQRKMERRLAMASTVAALSLRLLGASDDEDDDAIHEALARIGALTGADRSYVFLFDEAGDTMSNTHETCAEGIAPQREMLQDLPCSIFPWWMRKLHARERIHVPCVADLPPEASAEREVLQEQSIQSVLVVPLACDGRLAGFVGFDAVRRARTWDEEELLALDTLANLLALSFLRRRAVRTLEQEREQLLSLMNGIDEPIYAADLDTYEILFANRHLEARCGESLVGQVCYRALQGRSDPCPFCTNAILRERAPEPYRWEHHNEKLGSCYQLFDRLVRWPDGREVRFEIAIDVTETRRAREALRASERRFRGIFDQIGDGIVVAAPETGRIEMANRAMCELAGCTESELIELRGEDLLHDADQAQRQAWQEAWHGRETRTMHDLRIRRRGTSVLYADVTVSPVVLDERTLLVGSFRDVTERRALHAKLAQADRLASMGMLAAGVAHEINNPLAYVLYNTETIVQDLPRLVEAARRCLAVVGERAGPDALDEAAGEHADLLAPSMLDDLVDRSREALVGLHRIREITRGLGTFSRVEQKDDELVDVRQAMESALNMAFNEIKYRARLVKDYGKVPHVQGTEGKLAQVFLNLLINAAHAIPDGDVDGNRITIRTRLDGDEVVVEVDDSGAGIDAGALDRVFDPFYSTKGVGKGSGLGLAICKSIVEGLGGSIGVASERGVGSTFLVRLPVAGTRDGRRAVQPPSSRPPVHGRVLVVDDEAGIRKTLIRLLRRSHELVTAASGEEACALLEKDTHFDLILCDLMMPAMSGVDVHAWLSERDPDLAGRVVFMTGGAFTPRTTEYLDRVENLRIEKPFDATNLRKLVGELVLASRSRRG